MNDLETRKDDYDFEADFEKSLTDEDIWNSISDADDEDEPKPKMVLKEQHEDNEPLFVDEPVQEDDDAFANSLSEQSEGVNEPNEPLVNEEDFGEYPMDITSQYSTNSGPETTPPAIIEKDPYNTKSASPQYPPRELSKERKVGIFSNYPIPREFRDTENYITFSEISFSEISKAVKQNVPFNSTSFLRLRGVDYSTYPDDVVEFLRPYLVRHIFMVIDKGRPCGQIIVQFFNAREASDALREHNRKQLLSRYVEIIPFPEIPRPFWSNMHVLTYYRFSQHLKDLLKNKPRYENYQYPAQPIPHAQPTQYYNMPPQPYNMPPQPNYAQPYQVYNQHPIAPPIYNDPYATPQYTPAVTPVKAVDPRKKLIDREKQSRCSVELSQVPQQMSDIELRSVIDSKRIPWAPETFSRRGALCWFTVSRPEDVQVIIDIFNNETDTNGFPIRAKKWIPK